MMKILQKRLILFYVIVIGLIQSMTQNLYSQTVQTYTVTGSQNWTCPAGVNSVTVECWGAGAGSGGVANVLNAASGGGGGGAYARSVISVTPGNTYTIFVGVGGAGGSTSGTSGANGGASSFNTNMVFAEGGFGGGGSISSTALGAGGNGGGAATSIGTVKFSGGAGATGILNISGGGGGSSAGVSSIGNNASTSTGGGAPAGGVAGASASTLTTGAAGVNGLAGGSGASGSRRGSNAVAYNGANGGNGKVVLSYVCTPPTILASANPTLVCPGGTSTLTAAGPLTLDQQSTTGTTTGFWMSLSGQQTFVAGYTGILKKIRIHTATYASATNVTVNVMSGTPGSGSLLANIVYFKGTNQNSWDDVMMPGNGVALTMGSQYYIEILGGSQVDWIYNPTNVYPNGQSWRGGTSYNYDYNFETYMDLNTYLWNPGSISAQTFTANPASTTNYTVTVTNSTGCVNTQQVVLNVNPPLSPTVSQTNVSCNGGNNGTINLTPSGGTAPYTFNWGGGITTEDRTSLVAGVYSCTVTDVNTCTVSTSATITQPSALSAVTTVSNVSCFGGNNGAINLTLAGGAPPYIFNWGGGITTEDRVGIPAGVYTCTITDANGCVTVKTSTVTQPATALNANTIVTNVSCFGSSTGAINLTASGGTAPYTFNWGGGITTEDRFSLVAGVYTCTVTDVNTCTVTALATVTQPASALSGATTVINVSCFGGNNGAINLTASGGTGPYTFNWGGGITTEDRTGLIAGVYTCTITDINACTAIASATVTQPASVLSAATVVTNVSCFGANNGAINLTPSGGTTPYTFNWGGGITTEDRTGLVAGVYSCTVTDVNTCTVVTSATVTQPTLALSASTTVTNVLCFGGSTGAINLTPAGGTTPYTFNWGGGITTEDRTGLIAGVYTCTVTDVNACVTTVTSTITQPASAITASTTVTNVSCFGTSTGAINLTPSGGAAPYTFNWTGGITTEDRVNLASGTYSCLITDANTCTTSISATVTQPSVLTANSVLSTSINCNGGSGVVTVNASGGTPTYSGTGTFTVVAGTYTYTVTDFNGCVKTTTINVTQPAPLTITVSSSSPSICVGATASLTATGASTYTWNPGSLTGNSVTVSPTATTIYTATATSSLGCTDTKTINLIVNSNPTVTATSSSSAICSGASATLIGSGASSYTWNPGTITSTTAVVSPSITTNYTLTGTNATGCIGSQTINLVVNSNPTVSIVASPSVICLGQTSILTASGAISYLWNTSATTASITVSPTVTSIYIVTGTNSAGCSKTQTLNLSVNPIPTLTVSATSMSICNGSSVTLTANGASTYTWNPGTLTGSVVSVNPSSSTTYTVNGTNANGCVNSETITITVNSNPTVNAVASSSAICSGETATLTAGGASTYSWSSGSVSSTETITPTASSVYTVVGTDAVGCSSSATINITVNTLPVITISSSSATICAQSSATLTASGANTYSWSTSETTSIIEVAPSVSIVYTVTGTDALGCVNTETLNLMVNTLPSLSLTASPSSICAGATSTLSVSGANTYSWSTGSSLSTIFENPLTTTVYSVTGTNSFGCINTETISLTVNALPSLTISASPNAVCVGNSSTLTAVGASTYSWSSGGVSSSEVVSPSATTIYTVVGVDAIGCSSSDTVKVSVNALPNMVTNVNTNTVCLGGIVVFSNLGANTFTLMPSALTGSLINVPMNTVGLTVYTVTGTGSFGCTNTQTVSITTFDTPTISISPSTSTICAGQSVVLNASGASTYTWSGSGTVSNSITDAPSVNTTYSVIGTDINGCSNSASVTVNVSNTPTVSISSPSTSVCMGYTMTVTASGASSYNWSTGATTNTITVQPFTNTTFSVVGSNGGTCTDTAFLSLTILPLPSVSASASNTLVCSGQTVNLSASGTAVTYVWTPGTLIGANQTVQVTAPITYTVYGQATNGCAFLSTVLIDTKSGTTVTPITSPSVICIGDSAKLSVVGGSVPSWSNNVVPTVNIVAPLVATTYTYDATDVNGCASVVEFVVGIDPECNVVIYNGFTPNGDGINDVWIIDNIDKYTNNKVYIYNRWGNEIFSVSDYNNTTNVWDGKMNGQAITSGTYFFVIVDGSDKLIKKGWIEITN